MTDNVNVNVNIDEGMANRLNPFFFEASDNVLEDMINYVEVLRDGLTISGIDGNDLLIGQGLSYVTSRIGWYCLEHLDDFLSIVQDEKLREGLKSALRFLDEKADSLANKKNRVTPKSGSAHHTALSLFSFRPEYI